MNKVWNMMNRIKGRANSSTVKHLNVNNEIVTDKADIANTLAEQLAFNSSSEKCSDNFLKHKRAAEKKKINFKSSNDDYYTRHFSEDELKYGSLGIFPTAGERRQLFLFLNRARIIVIRITTVPSL